MASTPASRASSIRSEEHTSELQSPCNLVCRFLLEKKNTTSPVRIQKRIPIAPLPSLQIPSGIGLYEGIIAPRPQAFYFFFNDTATTEIYTLSLHNALPI